MALWPNYSKGDTNNIFFEIFVGSIYNTCMYVLDCHVEADQQLYHNLKDFKLYPLWKLVEPPSNLPYDMEVLARMKIFSPRTKSVHHGHYLQRLQNIGNYHI